MAKRIIVLKHGRLGKVGQPEPLKIIQARREITDLHAVALINSAGIDLEKVAQVSVPRGDEHFMPAFDESFGQAADGINRASIVVSGLIAMDMEQEVQELPIADLRFHPSITHSA